MIIKLKSLILSFVPPALTGLLAFFSANGNFDIYKNLRLPPFAPPPVLFRWVWTALYIIMGVTFYLLSRCDSRRSKKASLYLYLSLPVNVLWVAIFFGLQNFTLAVFVLIILWLLVFLSAIYSSTCGRRVWLTYVPYLIWLSFAAYLNVGVACLN